MSTRPGWLWIVGSELDERVEGVGLGDPAAIVTQPFEHRHLLHGHEREILGEL